VNVLPLPRPLKQDSQVVALLAQGFGQGAVVLEPAAALQRPLRGRLILPELRQGDFRFELAQLSLQAGFVKAPSGGRWPAQTGRCGYERARRKSS